MLGFLHLCPRRRMPYKAPPPAARQAPAALPSAPGSVPPESAPASALCFAQSVSIRWCMYCRNSADGPGSPRQGLQAGPDSPCHRLPLPGCMRQGRSPSPRQAARPAWQAGRSCSGPAPRGRSRIRSQGPALCFRSRRRCVPSRPAAGPGYGFASGLQCMPAAWHVRSRCSRLPWPCCNLPPAMPARCRSCPWPRPEVNCIPQGPQPPVSPEPPPPPPSGSYCCCKISACRRAASSAAACCWA